MLQSFDGCDDTLYLFSCLSFFLSTFFSTCLSFLFPFLSVSFFLSQFFLPPFCRISASRLESIFSRIPGIHQMYLHGDRMSGFPVAVVRFCCCCCCCCLMVVFFSTCCGLDCLSVVCFFASLCAFSCSVNTLLLNLFSLSQPLHPKDCPDI